VHQIALVFFYHTHMIISLSSPMTNILTDIHLKHINIFILLQCGNRGCCYSPQRLLQEEMPYSLILPQGTSMRHLLSRWSRLFRGLLEAVDWWPYQWPHWPSENMLCSTISKYSPATAQVSLTFKRLPLYTVVILSGALDSSALYPSYPITSLASHITIILIFPS
jgi:hypothetical protein